MVTAAVWPDLIKCSGSFCRTVGRGTEISTVLCLKRNTYCSVQEVVENMHIFDFWHFNDSQTGMRRHERVNHTRQVRLGLIANEIQRTLLYGV